MNLPAEFETKIKTVLGEEFPQFLVCYGMERMQGIRVNRTKISAEDFQRMAPFDLRPIPWVDNGFFYRQEDEVTRHPYYYAGLYYVQEPSAMVPASRLPVRPGERVLDLCAAPGGKATELGARLKGEGLLVANDISASRARALLRNLELFGISNAFVTSEVPARLARSFPEFFHKILLDAPCSGEGMFRKEPEVAAAWYPDRPRELAAIQHDLVRQAISMLRPGGLLLYSTCTFSPEENEGTISWLLEQYPEMEVLPIALYSGFSPGVPQWGNGDPRLAQAVRIWPHKMDGEGHFLCLLRKPGTLTWPSPTVRTRLDAGSRKILQEFFSGLSSKIPLERTEVRGEKAYLLPQAEYPVKGIRFLRNGLYLGDVKKNRFEPSQQLALILRDDQWPSVLHLDPEEERISRYLKGETLSLTPAETEHCQGWTLVCAGRYPLGWGKAVGQLLKNKYPAGWRIQG